MDSTTQTLSVLILLVALVVSVIVTQFARRRQNLFTLREIPAYTQLPLMVGQAIEANRPVHMSFGNTGVGGRNTLLALADAELFYQVSRRAMIGAISPIITLSDSSAIPVAYDTLRRAYAQRDELARYRSTNVRWLPSGPRSLAFAAGLTAMLGDDDVGANVLVGSFGPELALIAAAAARRNQPVIAASDELQGQAVAFAFSERPLIGEEIFAAGAYLGEGNNAQIASVVTIDVLRWLLIAFILIPTIIAVGDKLTENAFTRFITGLFGG